MCCYLGLISLVAVVIRDLVLADTRIPYYQDQASKIGGYRLAELADVLLIN
jgi:hypothetical protein